MTCYSAQLVVADRKCDSAQTRALISLTINVMSITASQKFTRRKRSRKATFFGAFVALALLLSVTYQDPVFAAPDDGLSRTVDGLTLYLGVMPSEIVGEHAGAQMHGGKRGKRVQHVVVAVYDAKTNERVTDATVRANVRDPGINVEEKALEPMRIAGTLTFGNYFVINPGTGYVITISVQRPGQYQPITAQFNYDRP